MKHFLVIIAGPTAVGKTALAVQLAKHYGTGVISADARQFYKEMQIGTARPDEAELEGVPHDFLGHLSIHDTYNVGQFEKDAVHALDDLFREHQVVFMAGGSGLYINAVCHGVDEFEEIPADIRTMIEEQYKNRGLIYLQEQVSQLDPVYYAHADTQNPQRLKRALEVCLHTGKPYSSFRTQHKKERPFEIIPILVNMDRQDLYKRIDRRVDLMMEAGLLKEAESLYPYRSLNALNTVGYKELFAYFDGACSLTDAVAMIKQNTRRYAKRQLTWFNNQGDYETFGPGDTDKIKAYIDIIIQNQ
ncbi:MAG: tRNA (adenosine(37)-N6)-dimethylallyltransferase MiaA [Bacteroidetes bacterium]|nr:tRNA (adenosine(37)-N6)-dimethylallyltransferase MiaA [Bacteroidota bacterium]